MTSMNLPQIYDVGKTLAQENPYFTIFLFGLGVFSLTRTIYQSLSVFLQLFILPGASLKRFGARKGAWAVITGATDGIGKEFAFQLAKAGFNVFLVARNKVLLESTASEIEAKYPGVSTQVHSIDFSTNDDAAYTSLGAAFKGLDIGVLVNNVGKSHDMPAYFVDTPYNEIRDILSININATLRVTYSVLPGMVQRKRGLVLNIGSFAGAIPSPMLATYSGTKGFLGTFSSALGEEVAQHNIIVENVNTYFVVSKLSKIRKASALIPQPGPYVRSVLSRIGLAGGAAYSNRPNTTTPYWSHGLLDYVLTLFNLRGFAIKYSHSLHRDIRKRALRKLERESKKA